MNKVVLIGRFTKDPEVKQTPSNLSVCSFTVAVDRKFKDKDGNRQADFINVVAWRQLADIIGQYFHKGSKIGITGSLQSRYYEDQNGNKRTVTEVVVEEIEFLDPKQKTESQTQALPEYDARAEQEVDESTLPFDVAGY